MEEYKKILVSVHCNSSSPALHNMTTLIISSDEIHDIIKIIKSLEDSSLLIEGITKTIQNEVKEQKGVFLSMLLGILGAGLLGNILTGKGAIATSQGRGIYRVGKGKGLMATSQGRRINRAGETGLRAGYGRPSYSASQNKIDF